MHELECLPCTYVHLNASTLTFAINFLQSQLSESSYNGSAAAEDVVPYELWSNWSEQEVASWVRSHPSLKS